MVAETKMPPRFRKLRISWSVLWSLAAVLFCLLSVISYWWFGSIECRWSSTSNLMVNCVKGSLYVGNMLDTDLDWNVTVEPLSGSVRSTAKEVRSGNVTETVVVDGPIDLEQQLREEMNWRGHFGFGLSHCSDVQFVSAPNWFLAIISTAFAVAPWKLRQVVRRFSLRALFIATTLIAVVLGLVVWAARK